MNSITIRCVWKGASVENNKSKGNTITHTLIDKLHVVTGKPGPTFRPSLKLVDYFFLRVTHLVIMGNLVRNHVYYAYIL